MREWRDDTNSPLRDVSRGRCQHQAIVSKAPGAGPDVPSSLRWPPVLSVKMWMWCFTPRAPVCCHHSSQCRPGIFTRSLSWSWQHCAERAAVTASTWQSPNLDSAGRAGGQLEAEQVGHRLGGHWHRTHGGAGGRGDERRQQEVQGSWPMREEYWEF